MTLASIQKIIDITPIENADRIETAKVLGWDCVVKKGTFKPGDLCIYIEIDTIIPKYLLDETYIGDEVIRLRTVKMKGQISQGLVLPLTALYTSPTITREDFEEREKDNGSIIGVNVTDWLNIKKYEKQIPPQLQGLAYGDFPTNLISKTDEVRIQSVPHYIDELWEKPYYITCKLDGTSATYIKYNGEFMVCSRKLRLKNGDNIYWNMARKYNLADKLADGFVIQGEICGPSIQDNKLALDKHDLFVFNAYIIHLNQYLSYKSLLSMAYLDQFKLVPIHSFGSEFRYTIDDLLKLTDMNYNEFNAFPNSKSRIEGIVVRPQDEIKVKKGGGRLSFKVMNNKFLLDNKE